VAFAWRKITCLATGVETTAAAKTKIETAYLLLIVIPTTPAPCAADGCKLICLFVFNRRA
jgi:hypothetical protein